MVNNHIKRIAAPKTWRVLRKTTTFITKPFPGSNNQKLSISINTFLKELTGLTKTLKETKYILTKQEVLINGKRIRDHKQAVGFLDTIDIPSAHKKYRLVIDSNGTLQAKKLNADEKEIKTILKITGKRIIRGGKTQINTMSGRNILVSAKDAKSYKIGDSIIVTIPGDKVQAHFSREKGAHVIVFIGKHSGKSGSIEEIKEGIVRIKTKEETFETNKEYILITGKTKSELDVEI